MGGSLTGTPRSACAAGRPPSSWWVFLAWPLGGVAARAHRGQSEGITAATPHPHPFRELARELAPVLPPLTENAVAGASRHADQPGATALAVLGLLSLARLTRAVDRSRDRRVCAQGLALRDPPTSRFKSIYGSLAFPSIAHLRRRQRWRGRDLSGSRPPLAWLGVMAATCPLQAPEGERPALQNGLRHAVGPGGPLAALDGQPLPGLRAQFPDHRWGCNACESSSPRMRGTASAHELMLGLALCAHPLPVAGVPTRQGRGGRPPRASARGR